jgi:predicted ester cyclase
MGGDTNKDTLGRYYREVWAKGDPGPLEELLADDYVDHNPFPGISAGKDGAAQTVTSVMDGTSDVQMDVAHLIGEGDFVAAHWRMEWTQHGDFMGTVPADGRRLSLEGHDFARFAGGRIAEIWHVEDVMGVMGQLGVLGGDPPA